MCRRLTLSSGERSVEVDAESEDMAEGGLTWPDRSEREVEVLMRQHIRGNPCFETRKSQQYISLN